MAIKLKKQDLVKVISGKAKGQSGRIVKVNEADLTVVVEGVNKAKKHQKPSQRDQKGGIIEKEMPVHISNVMLLNKESKPVKVKKVVQNGRRVRVEAKTGKALD
jgi:large subunit ribosomal protein L24